MVATVPAYVYVLPGEQFESVRAILEGRSTEGSSPVAVLREEGELSAVVESARKRHGNSPLGFITSSEADALEAISLGADDAVVLDVVDEPPLNTFLDRVRLRAGQRREHERLSSDLVQAERLTVLGTLLAGVGHEINNPLAAIVLTLDMARRVGLPDLDAIWELKRRAARGGALSAQEVSELVGKLRGEVDFRELLDEISAATNSVAQVVQDLRVFSRNNQIEASTVVEPSTVIEHALRLVRREIAAGGIVERDYEPQLPKLVVPRNRLTQVLTNLLVNAAHAIREVDRPFHQVRVGARVDDQFMALSVSDTGPGIPEESLETIFDPFFTTKREGLGTGLGLSISRSILRQMGGDLVVSSVYGEGATFICFVPLPSEQDLHLASRSEVPLARAPDALSSLSVLLVDDDERVLRASSRVLGGRYKVLIARDGEEAVELLASGSHADVIVTELDMPEMNGKELIEWLRQHRPELARRAIVATGAQERPGFREFLAHSDLVVLHKPFATTALLQAIEHVADSRLPG